MKIKIKVKPNSEEQKIEKKRGYYIVNLKSPPKNGKANLELIKFLRKYFNQQVKIKSGLRSKEKIIEI